MLLIRALLLLALVGCGAKSGLEIIELPPCADDAECDDGLFCNGEERCDPESETCRRGAPPVCVDDDPCTIDECDDATRMCVFPEREVADDDGDTFRVLGVCGDDCDDTNAAVNPGATEVCNGIDDDCDGRVDEGAAYTPSGLEQRLTFEMPPNGRGNAVYAPTTESWGATWWGGPSGSTDVFFQQLAEDGTPLDEPKQITRTPGDAFGAAVVWSGEEYGIAWQDRRDGVWEIYFNRLTPDGEKLQPDLRVTFAPDWSVNPSLLWTGEEYLVAWQDWRHRATAPDNFEVYYTFIDRSGLEIGDDIRLTRDPDNSEAPTMAMWRTGDEGEIAMVFVDGRTGNEQVWLTILDVFGEVVVPEQRLSTSTGDAFGADVVWAEDAFVVAWQEELPDGSFDVVAARVERPSGRVDGPFTLVGGEPWSRRPKLLFNGDSLLLSYSDDRLGSYDLWAALYDPRLMRLSDDIRVTTGPADTVFGTLERGGTAVGMLFEDQRDGNWEVYFTRLLCAD